MDILFELVLREEEKRINLLWLQKLCHIWRAADGCGDGQWLSTVTYTSPCASTSTCLEHWRARRERLAAKQKRWWSISPPNKNAFIHELERVGLFLHRTEDDAGRMTSKLTLPASANSQWDTRHVHCLEIILMHRNPWCAEALCWIMKPMSLRVAYQVWEFSSQCLYLPHRSQQRQKCLPHDLSSALQLWTTITLLAFSSPKWSNGKVVVLLSNAVFLQCNKGKAHSLPWQGCTQRYLRVQSFLRGWSERWHIYLWRHA